MEEDRFGFSFEEEIKQTVQKFERMKKNNERCFFDVIEFETIIDYYIESNNSAKAFEAAALASEQHPHSVSIQLRKAKVLLDKGRAVEALRLLKKLESIEPGNHELLLQKGLHTVFLEIFRVQRRCSTRLLHLIQMILKMFFSRLLLFCRTSIIMSR